MNFTHDFILRIPLAALRLAGLGIVIGALVGSVQAPAQSLITAGGKGSEVALGTASFVFPSGLAVDRSGNIYFSEEGRIRKVSSETGLVTIVAGRGLLWGYSGDGGQALAAELNHPAGLAIDPAGNLWIGEFLSAVRKIDLSTGIISSVLRNGGYAGDGGPASAALANLPTGVAVDGKGNVFFADSGNERVRRIDASSSSVSTVAGNGTAGYSGDGGPATLATLNIGLLDGGFHVPAGIAVDGVGNVFIADTGNQRIRRVDAATGIITTLAGDGTAGFEGDGGPATLARLHLTGSGNPLAVDAKGNVYVADYMNNRVRRVEAVTGNITTIAGLGSGIGQAAYDPGPGPAIAMNLTPHGLALGPRGDLYVADHNQGQVIRRIALDTGVMTTVAGVAPASATTLGDGLPSNAATLAQPEALAVDRQGNILVYDMPLRRLRVISPADGTLTTLAGTGSNPGPLPGPLADAAFCVIAGITVDHANDIYVADGCGHMVRKINRASSTITHVAGTGVQGDSGDGGPATAAQFLSPAGLSFDRDGGLLIVDAFAGKIRRIAPGTGTISTIAGTGTGGPPGDGGPATAASLSGPMGIVVNAAGTILVAEQGGARVRSITPDGIIRTIAGTGKAGYSGDGGPATAALLNKPMYLAFDSAGDLYIADTRNSRVRKVSTSSGRITTYTGNGLMEFSSDGAPAAVASLAVPVGLGFDPSGNLFVSSASDGRVRAVFACRSVDRPQLVSPVDGSTSDFGNLDLTWSPARGAFSYDVYLDTNPVPGRILASNISYTTPTPFWVPKGASLSTTVSNLQSARSYSWRVLGKGDPNCSPVANASSSVALFTTKRDCIAPDPFTLQAPTPGSTETGTSTTLTWTAAAGAKYYDLYLGSTNPPRLYQQSVSGTSLTVTGLQPSTTYYWYLIAFAECDASRITGSAVSHFTTSGVCPELGPFSLTAPPPGSTTGSTSVTLAWSASRGAGAYDLYLGRTAAPALYQANVSGTSLTVSGLSPGATYFWNVVARSGCDKAKTLTTTVASFAVGGTCVTPATPAFTFVPPGAVAVGQSYVLTWATVALDPGGSYLIERSKSTSFSPVTESLLTNATGASFVATSPGTWFHRVQSVAGCDAQRRSVPSATAQVNAVDGKPVVVITKPPQAIVTALGASLDDALNASDPEQKGRVFTVQNISTTAVRALASLNVIPPSPNFFQVEDLGGQPAYLGINLAPGESRQYRIRFTGVPSDTPASYQGIVYVTAAGQEIIPYAFVNLKVGGTSAAVPEIRVSGTPSEYAFFQGLPAGADDSSRAPLTIEIFNPGTSPMELAAEIGPEVWLEPDAGWNATPIPPGASRTVPLRTRRTRALSGAAFPRYTYFTVRTRNGATARLMVQDSDLPVQAQDPRSALAPGTASYIVPSVVHATSKIGSTFVSRLRLSNAASEDVQVELVFTPAGADGFDTGAVRRLKLTVPRNDVVSLTDPLVQLFGLPPPAVGQLEVRADPSRLGALTVTSGVDAPARSGGTFGFQLPILRRGDGASLGQPQIIPAITLDATYRSNVILAETTGRDGASVAVTLFDAGGTKLGEKLVDVRRYGQAQFALSDLLGQAQSLTAGLVEISVTSGGASVGAVVTVIDNVNDDSSTYVSRPAAPAAPGAALVARFGKARLSATATSAVRLGVPAVVNGYSTFPGSVLPYTFQTQMVFTSGTQLPATFTLTYTDLAQGSTKITRSLTVPGRGSRTYDNVLEQLFGIPPGQKSQGPVLVDASANGSLTARVYSRLENGTLGDSFPVITLPPQSVEQLTGASAAHPLALDGLEQSIDASRGTRSNLILNEWTGQSATVTVRLYEAGNRSRPIAEEDVTLAPWEKKQLSNVFSGLGLETDEKRKDRANVLCVVTPKAGGGLVSGVVTTIDNKTGDTRNSVLSPAGATQGGGVIGF